MGNSKGRSGSGPQLAVKVKSRRRRLAVDEAARERHARLVAERAGDPRYVQQETFPGGRTIRWDPDTPLGAKFRETFKGRITAFRAKFGRDPGPDDPLFFDPNADEPAPLSEDTWNTAIDGMIANADQIGLDPAYLKAWRELGYLITEENQHLFSAAEVQEFLDTWARYLDDGDDDDADLDISDIVDLLADQLETAVQETLTQQSAEPARLLAAIVGETDAAVLALEYYDVEDEGAPTVSIAFASDPKLRSPSISVDHCLYQQQQ